MKNEKNPEKKKLLLAYLSIGEAEDYRAYWKKAWRQSPPSWLGRENPDWRGNYKVRFWNKDWKKIASAELARIVKSGFDGVYLDIVDAFYYWSLPETFQNRESKKKNDPKDEAESAERMIDFLGEIASRARKQSGGFLVFPQNGETILLSATPEQRKLYWETVDGICVEDVFHFGPDDENNPANVEAYRLELLAHFVQKKKPVLSVEYLTKPKLVQTFTALARKKGFIPLTTIRSLAR